MVLTHDGFKRIRAFALALMLACGFLAAGFFTPEKKYIVARADSWSDNGIKANSFAGGDGSIQNPFLIANAAQLGYMAFMVNGNGGLAFTLATHNSTPGIQDINKITYANSFYKLTANIDLTKNPNTGMPADIDFTPIGQSAFTPQNGLNSDDVKFNNINSVFQGHFNGDNYTITGLKGGALFGATDSAYIRNFDLTGVDITTATGHVGAVVNVGIDTEVRNVSVNGTIESSPDLNGECSIGGIIGYGVRSSVFACENNAVIDTTTTNPGLNGGQSLNVIPKAGGLAGVMLKGGLGDCINQGTVTGYCAGGILGYGMQASINRTINSAKVESAGSATISGYAGDPTGEFIGAFNTITAKSSLSIVKNIWPAALKDDEGSCIMEAGALIKDSFYNTDAKNNKPCIGVKNSGAVSGWSEEAKGLTTVKMTGRMMQKLYMSDWQDDGAEDLLFYKWWEYQDGRLPRPIRWEMWVDSAEPVDPTATSPAPHYTPARLAYCAYMINRGLWDETKQKTITLIAGPGNQYGNIDLYDKLWTPFGTIKNPYKGEKFNILSNTPVSYTQALVANPTINSALSYQSFFGVVKQRSSGAAAAPNATLKVNDIHLAGMDVWGGSVDQTAGFVSLYVYHDISQGTHTILNPLDITAFKNDIDKYYQFNNCITSGDISAYGNAVGVAAGYSDLENNDTLESLSVEMVASPPLQPTPPAITNNGAIPGLSLKTRCIFIQSGNAADIVSFAGNACGLVYNFSNIKSLFEEKTFLAKQLLMHGLIHCFNTGKVSALREGGIASGLISYINATAPMAISNCYNAGDLIVCDGGKQANFAGDIDGIATCSFLNSYYRKDVSGIAGLTGLTCTDPDAADYGASYSHGGVKNPGNAVIGTSQGLPVDSMKGGVYMNSMSAGVTVPQVAAVPGKLSATYWKDFTTIEGNNSCPIGTDSIPFYNIDVRVNDKRDGDIKVSAKVVQATLTTPVAPANGVSSCNDVTLTAYPTLGDDGNFVNWTRGNSNISMGNGLIMQFGLFNSANIYFTANFTAAASVTVASSNPDWGAVDIEKGSSGPNNNAGIFTCIYPANDSVNITATASITGPQYKFDGWGLEEYGQIGPPQPVVPSQTTYNLSAPEKDKHIILYAKFSENVYVPQFILKTTIFKVEIKASSGGSGKSSQEEFNENDTAVLRAYPNKGYKFAGWYDVSGALVSADAVYSFTVIGNQTFEPRFVKEGLGGVIFASVGGALLLISVGLFLSRAFFFKKDMQDPYQNN